MQSLIDNLNQKIIELELQVEYYKESAALWRLSFIDATKTIRHLKSITRDQGLLEGEIIY